MMEKNFSIAHYSFDQNLDPVLHNEQKDFLIWPIVYFLQNNEIKEAYVGETTDMLARLKTHSQNLNKKKLNKVSLIRSHLFNKSATLDIEANLIRYIAADGNFSLQNGNLGLSDHSFYQKKEVYWSIFKEVWKELQSAGIARHSIEYIDNSDLFKYSPYKSLSREQTLGLKMILNCLLDENAKVSLIHGGAGTGKSILAIYLFKLLKTDLNEFNRTELDESDAELFDLVRSVRSKYGSLEIGFVIPMQSFRKTVSNVFQKIKGLSSKMVIGPAAVANKKYDLLIVDESHRLRQWKNLASYYGTFRKVSHALEFDEFTCTEVDWILKQSSKSIFFYDESQSIKPSDANPKVFQDLQLKESTRTERLYSQFRVKGGDQYVRFIHELFRDQTQLPPRKFKSQAYDFRLFTNLSEMIDVVKVKDQEMGLSRLVAGFAWKWISKKKSALKDIVIGDIELRWNSNPIDWVNSPNAINEVGCIHTTQGYDLNYTGVIIGPELDYDFDQNCFLVYKDRYHDKNGKNTIKEIDVLRDYIFNIYKTILLRGIRGTFLYACNPNLQKYLAQYLPLYSNGQVMAEYEVFPSPGHNRIPLFISNVAESPNLNHDSEEITQFIEVSNEYSDSNRYFAYQIMDNSMDEIIPKGSICLFDRNQEKSPEGLIWLIESEDSLMSDVVQKFSIKELASKNQQPDRHGNQELILIPRSNDSSYSSIIIKPEDFSKIQLVGSFVKVLTHIS